MGWLFPTPADTLLTGGWATGVERRSESERGEIGGIATAPWATGSRGTRGRSSVIGSFPIGDSPEAGSKDIAFGKETP